MRDVAARAVVNADRRLGRRPGRGRHAAAQPRHPPRAARRHPARAADRGHRARPGLDQPLRAWCSPSPTARSTSASPTSRSTGRCPTYRSRPSRRSASCSTWSPRRSPTTCAAPTWSARTPGCGRCWTSRPTGGGQTADLSRRHAVLTSRSGVVTVVGGKLTTYRRMAEDAVDRVVDGEPARRRPVPHPHPAADRRRIPARAGAARGAPPAGPPLRHRRRAGARRRARGHRPVRRRAAGADRRPRARSTLAELVFGVTHEGAADVDDLLDRRTRVGLVPADRALAVPAAERALALVAAASAGSPRQWHRRRPMQHSSLDYRGLTDPTDEFRRSTPVHPVGRLTEPGEPAMRTATVTSGPDRPTDRAAGLRRADPALPARAAGALLPDERLGPRGRGPGAGDVPARLEGERRLPGPLQRPHLALPDRHQRLPHQPRGPARADRCRPGSARPTSDAADPLDAQPEIPWLEPIPDAAVQVEEKDTIRLAFVAALQHLPGPAARGADPARRAALVGRRGRRGARHHRRRGQLRAAARPRPDRQGRTRPPTQRRRRH